MAGAVTAVFNCQGPLDAPVFVGSGIVSRKSLSISGMPPSAASEAVMQNKEAGAVAAFDHIPFSHVSANFTFNLDNCVSTNIAKILAILEVEELVIVSLWMQVADLYGIRACLLDGGEIRGAGNAWICPEVLLLRSVLLFQSVILLCLSQTNFFLLRPWWLQFVASRT